MNRLGQHRIALGRARQQFARSPLAGLLTVLVIGIALSLPVGLFTLVDNLSLLAGRIHPEPQITLFLSPDADAQNIENIEQKLNATPTIRNFRFVPRDQALQGLLEGAGLDDVAAGLPKNPLPDAFVLDTGDAAPAKLEHLRDELAKLPKVDFVQLDTLWAKRLGAMMRLGQDFAVLLAILLGFALVAVTGNTIRLQILSQREEIETSKLIGATDAYIRQPFLYHGLLQGFFGGLTAIGIVSLGLYFLNRSVDELARLYGMPFHLQSPDTGVLLGLLLTAGLLGWLGAFFSVARHLHQIEPK